MPVEERAHGTISLKTYYQYFKAGGGHIFTAVVLLVFIITEVLSHLMHCIGKRWFLSVLAWTFFAYTVMRLLVVNMRYS